MGKDTSSNIKKKRKSNTEGSEQEVDIYKKVVDYEEKESRSRSSSIDAEIFFDICDNIRNLLQEIYEVKVNDPTSKKGKELQMEIFMKLCVIKKLNRIDKMRHIFGRDVLSVEKQKCDSIKLNYQNLVYELHHLVTETNKCLSFKSKDEDIELVSFEEFMKEAPELLTEKFEQYDPENREQLHSLRLARLEFELSQRKNLALLCKSLVEEQKKLGKDLVERREKLNTLRPLLLNIINATKPLQEHLDIPPDELRSEHKLAFLLPDPLYIFYVNAVSYNNVYELNLNVNILGDEDEASQWKDTNGSSDILTQNDDDWEQETESQEVEEVKKRRHRSKSTHQLDPLEEKKKKLLEVHPLSVEITAKLDNGLAVTITFQYRTKLKIITVTSKSNIPTNITANTACDILSGENILNELIDGDFGKDSPNPVTPYQLQKCGFSSYQALVSQIGFAYHWAQRVCGMDFLIKQMNSDQIGRANVENVIKLLMQRLQTRFDLAQQLQQLDQNTIPKLSSEVFLPTTRVSSLVKWSTCTYQRFCQTEFTRSLVDDDIPSSTDLFYLAVFERNSASLQAVIILKNNYPDATPIFSLCLQYKGQSFHAANNDDIRDMERIVNLPSVGENIKPSWILSFQITTLCSILDVYLETLDSKVFPQNTTFIRKICGRNRKRPFKFRKLGSGIFTQY